MKMEKKQCTKCRQPLPLECFRIGKRTAQLIKCCMKCLDSCKRSKQRAKCEHNKIKSICKDCGRGQTCEHNKIKSRCKGCGKGHICQHNKIRSECKDCGGGGICEHKKRRSICKDCGGGQICEHNKTKSQCKDCNPLGHLVGVVRGRIYTALKNDKEMSSKEHLGCSIETFKQHIEQQLSIISDMFCFCLKCHKSNLNYSC